MRGKNYFFLWREISPKSSFWWVRSHPTTLFFRGKTFFIDCQRFVEPERFCVGIHLKVSTFALSFVTWIRFRVCKIEDFRWNFVVRTQHFVHLFLTDVIIIFIFRKQLWSKSKELSWRRVVSNGLASCETFMTSSYFDFKILNHFPYPTTQRGDL